MSRYHDTPHTRTITHPKGGRLYWGHCALLRCLPLLALVWIITLAGGVGRLQAQSDDVSDLNREYAIKAAYLYQFGRYVQWPSESFATPQSPLVIGLLGPDPFGGILNEIARTKRLEGRPIVVRQFATMADYTPCHIMFVSAAVPADQKTAAIQQAQGKPILLVGEEPGFAERGGTINFFMEENRIRFEINTEVARQDQLKISSKLLSLARIIGRQ